MNEPSFLNNIGDRHEYLKKNCFLPLGGLMGPLWIFFGSVLVNESMCIVGELAGEGLWLSLLALVTGER